LLHRLTEGQVIRIVKYADDLVLLAQEETNCID